MHFAMTVPRYPILAEVYLLVVAAVGFDFSPVVFTVDGKSRAATAASGAPAAPGAATPPAGVPLPAPKGYKPPR